MGTLISGAVPRLRFPEEANFEARDTVVSLHVSFINAGADLIETNTFGANRRKLAVHRLDDQVGALNSAAVKLAREAREISGRDVYIGGSIGPLGDHGDLSPDERHEIFAEQATALQARGVDLFIVETFFELEELLIALAAVRAVSSLPIVAMLTFDEQGETLGGVTARKAIESLAESDLAAIGANHGAGVHAALTALNEMHDADGGMGALVSSAVPRLRCPEEANLRAPDAVVSLHVGFINAGAELIETNTFGANRRKLSHHFLEDELERINSTAAVRRSTVCASRASSTTTKPSRSRSSRRTCRLRPRARRRSKTPRAESPPDSARVFSKGEPRRPRPLRSVWPPPHRGRPVSLSRRPRRIGAFAFNTLSIAMKYRFIYHSFCA